MWLFIGLGNPGDKYKNNRHNIGFMAVDRIAQDYNFPAFRSKFQGMMSEKIIDNQKLVLLKPTTYMNESGRSAQQAAKFYKIEPNRIVCFYDELDIAPGKVKIKQGGGAAGHNGIKSLMAHLGSPDFWRVRLGIGHPGDKNRVSGYVLSDFSKSEQLWLESLLDNCSRHVDLLMNEDISQFIEKTTVKN